MPPDVTIGSFRFSLGLQRVTLLGEVLFASSDIVHTRNPAQSPEEFGLCLWNQLWIFHTQLLLLIALMPANKPWMMLEFSNRCIRHPSFGQPCANYQSADQSAWRLELCIPMVKNGIYFLALQHGIGSARGRFITLHSFLASLDQEAVFSKPLSATSSRRTQWELYREQQIFSKALNSAPAISGELF